MKIAVYAISKNEEKFVKQFCESAKEADLILIADTGSTDETVRLAKECGAIVYTICINPWRFDKARDAALALVPADVDVCVSLDLDEKLEPNWRQEIERVWKENTTRLRYKYDWGSGVVFYSEKIHHRHGYHWHHPAHEYIRADKRTKEVYATIDQLLVTHHQDPTKPRSQYLPLLKMSVEEDPHCPRNAFYYARELFYYGKWQDAIEALKRFLAMPEANWPLERAYAMRIMARCYEELGLIEDATRWFMDSIKEAPTMRDAWVDLAMMGYKQKDWKSSYQAATSALLITSRGLDYMVEPSAWGFLPHDLAGIAAWNLGMKEAALKHTKEALNLDPANERILKNLKIMQGESV